MLLDKEVKMSLPWKQLRKKERKEEEDKYFSNVYADELWMADINHNNCACFRNYAEGW
jgi:hypothetical protein